MNSNAVLSLNNIVHAYTQGGRGLTILNHLDFDILPGKLWHSLGLAAQEKQHCCKLQDFLISRPQARC